MAARGSPGRRAPLPKLAGVLNETRAPRWGLGDVALGFAFAYTLVLFLDPVVRLATGQELDTPRDDLPLSTVALLQVPFFAGLAGAALVASHRKGSGPVADFGARMQPADVPVGLALGVAAQLAAALLYLPLFWWTDVSGEDVEEPARELTDKATGAGVVLLILVVCVAAPLVEELFFRGLVLRAFERRFGIRWAIVASTGIFGIAHFQLIQLPALLLFGAVAAVLTARSGRLGPAVWAHVAFNSSTVLVLLM